MQTTRAGILLFGLLLALAPAASAATVQLTMAVDDAVIVVDQTTTLHVFGEVTDGVVGNGIWAYALNVLTDASGVVAVDSVQQLGNPDAGFSDPGTRGPNGIRDVFGGDGGFYSDQNRGIGAPFELLAIELQALALGDVAFSAGPAGIAGLVGINAGFLLQQMGPVNVDFGDGAALAIVPEPSSMLLLLGSLGFLAARRRR